MSLGPTSPSPVLSAPLLLPAEKDAAAAIGADWNPPQIAAASPALGSTAFAVAGVAIILAAWLGFSIVSSLLGFFQVSPALGVAAAAIAGLGLALLAFAILREWRSLRGLHQVDHLRAGLLTGTNSDAARSLCLSWLERIGDRVPEAAMLAPAIRDAQDVAEMRGILRGRLTEPLRGATRATGLRAATEVSALVAISPHASWDGPIVALRGLKVIRQVATLHGLRPGPAVTVALLRRVARAAVESATIDLVSQAAADQFLNNLPLVRHLGAIAGASTAAFRLYRLTLVAGQACNPLAE